MFGIIPKILERVGFGRQPATPPAKTPKKTPEPSNAGAFEAETFYDHATGEMRSAVIGGEPVTSPPARTRVNDAHEVGGE